MKKLFKTLAICAVAGTMCVGAAAFAACGGNDEEDKEPDDKVVGTTYDGEYSYPNAWTAGQSYGVKVHVTVNEGKITAVTYDADTDVMHNVTPSWKAHDAAVAAIDKYLADTFVGKTVEEVLAIKVDLEENGEPTTLANGQTLDEKWILSGLQYQQENEDGEMETITTGATQTSGRFILAIQDALGTHTGTSYALVHSEGSYVGVSSVTVDRDKKITEVTLTEVCTPNHNTYVSGTDDEGKNVTAHYAKVTYGDVVMLWDDATGNYKVGEQTIVQYLSTEANCKAYYEAVMANAITAYKTEDSEGETNVMTHETLCKDENGYWSGAQIRNGQLGWEVNRDATINYVMTYGVEGLKNLAKDPDKDEELGNDYWLDSNGVSTGATWTDMYSTNANGFVMSGETATASISYGQLIINAYNLVK